MKELVGRGKNWVSILMGLRSQGSLFAKMTALTLHPLVDVPLQCDVLRLLPSRAEDYFPSPWAEAGPATKRTWRKCCCGTSETWPRMTCSLHSLLLLRLPWDDHVKKPSPADRTTRVTRRSARAPQHRSSSQLAPDGGAATETIQAQSGASSWPQGRPGEEASGWGQPTLPAPRTVSWQAVLCFKNIYA